MLSYINTSFNPTSAIYSQINSNFTFLNNELNKYVPISGSKTIAGQTNFTSRPTINGVGVLLVGEAAGTTTGSSNTSTIVYTSGNQTISGVKNFVSRPTVNGVGVLLQNEVGGGGTGANINTSSFVQISGNQTISGIKTFSTDILAGIDVPTNRTISLFSSTNNFDISNSSGILNLKNTSTNATLLQIQPETNPARIEFPSLPLGQKQKVMIGSNSINNGVTILELNSTTQGFLPPRLTTSQRNALQNVINVGNTQTITHILPTGLIIYNTTSRKLEAYDGIQWNSLKEDDGAVPFYPVTVNLTATTAVLAPNGIANLDIPAGCKSYALKTITISDSAYVSLYVDSSRRTADANRSRFSDPALNAGVVAEAITSGVAKTVTFAPCPIGFFTSASTLPIKVQNLASSSKTVTVFISILKLE
jgi:hypothetical protein